jgi:uncharacterized GH25 family protein
MRQLVALTLAALGWLTPPCLAHYNMLLPQTASAKKGETVTFTYQWGHPFEHQLFDAPEPVSVVALAPDGKTTDLTKALTKTKVPAAEGKEVVAYQFKFTPDQRGDYVFVLKTALIYLKEEEEYVEDTVKVVLHVQAQKGWDGLVHKDFEFAPLTRPYGLQPGMAFQAKIDAAKVELASDGKWEKLPEKPFAGALIEIEKYNATPPKSLPPDEQITRTAKTDPNGVVTCTLTDPGWWCVTARRNDADLERRSKRGGPFQVYQRSTLWVFVDEKPAAK